MISRSDVGETVVGNGASKRTPEPVGLDDGQVALCGVKTIAPLKRGPHEFIEDQVERTPDAPALTLGPEQISYRELNSPSNRVAYFLREQGVGPESLVGVCLDWMK